MPLILGTNSIKDTGYDVANSARFDSASSDNLQRTYGTPTNAKIFGLSWWIKISKTGAQNDFWGERADTSNRVITAINTDGTFQYFEKNGGSTALDLKTNRLFRDVSAWYHFLILVDTTQGTASNRLKLYINGVQETSFATETYPAEDYTPRLSTNTVKYFGRVGNGGSLSSNYINGYLAEAAFVDGNVTAHTDYGEFDEDSGIWKPIDVSGLTFGNNGFYLDFEDSSALGDDVSGNGNDFTVNNLTAIDQSTDTCTNNFATLNPLAQTTTKGTVSQGNLEYDRSGSSDGWVSILSTIGASSGKYYAEVKIIDVGSPSQGCVLGFLNLDESNIQSSSSTYLGAATADAGMGWYSVGNVFRQGGHVNIINSYTDNDIVMLAMDLDNGFCYFGKNGSWENSGDPTSGSSGTGGYATSNMTANGTYCFAVSCREAGNVQMNFGSPSFAISSGNTDGNGYGNFEYAPPSGYYALNTKNLAEYG